MPRLNNVLVPLESCYKASPVDITITNGRIESVSPSAEVAQPPSLLIPPLCHPHIHLDKAYILTSDPSDHADLPNYSDLQPQTGSFSEALQNTSLAKTRYTRADLHLRGSQLMATSLSYGVTCARAFVEVDHVTGTLPLEVGVQLKREFAPLHLEVQLCAFAQDPLFSTEYGDANREVLETALRNPDLRPHVSALGATPYVEKGREAALRNIEWTIRTALELELHVDFHLDYNLEDPKEVRPMVYDVVDALVEHGWPTYDSAAGEPGLKTVALGHCTQLTRLSNHDLAALVSRIKSLRLPLHFVGLPTSDIFMMGRPAEDSSCCGNRPRGTLQILSLIKDHGIGACIGVNNVGNAFTPFGSGDPLNLANWGVGLYHAGIMPDAELLYGCVSWLARRAIGCEPHERGGESADVGKHSGIRAGEEWQTMLMVKNLELIETVSPSQGSGPRTTVSIPARQRRSVKDVVWDPPESPLRFLV